MQLIDRLHASMEPLTAAEGFDQTFMAAGMSSSVRTAAGQVVHALVEASNIPTYSRGRDDTMEPVQQQQQQQQQWQSAEGSQGSGATTELGSLPVNPQDRNAANQRPFQSEPQVQRQLPMELQRQRLLLWTTLANQVPAAAVDHPVPRGQDHWRRPVRHKTTHSC